MKIWEYMSITGLRATATRTPEIGLIQKINDYGEDGWELVSVLPDAPIGHSNIVMDIAYMKREVKP